MANILRTLIIAITALAASGGVALACSCLRYATPAEHIANTDVIVLAEVVRSERAPNTRAGMVTTFRVIERLKGEAPAEVRVRHNDDTCCICGIVYTRGERVLVFAHSGEKGLSTGSCSAPRFSEAEYRAALARD